MNIPSPESVDKKLYGWKKVFRHHWGLIILGLLVWLIHWCVNSPDLPQPAPSSPAASQINPAQQDIYGDQSQRVTPEQMQYISDSMQTESAEAY